MRLHIKRTSRSDVLVQLPPFSSLLPLSACPFFSLPHSLHLRSRGTWSSSSSNSPLLHYTHPSSSSSCCIDSHHHLQRCLATIALTQPWPWPTATTLSFPTLTLPNISRWILAHTIDLPLASASFGPSTDLAPPVPTPRPSRPSATIAATTTMLASARLAQTRALSSRASFAAPTASLFPLLLAVVTYSFSSRSPLVSQPLLVLGVWCWRTQTMTWDSHSTVCSIEGPSQSR